ncbi:MAG TPA: hypothetical protein VL097_08785, partial [Rhodanobacter sp.]|nr:hypothetical protein [Rhodanobacter sp.]
MYQEKTWGSRHELLCVRFRDRHVAAWSAPAVDENTHGLLRQYLPRRGHPGVYSEAGIQAIEDKLNHGFENDQAPVHRNIFSMSPSTVVRFAVESAYSKSQLRPSLSGLSNVSGGVLRTGTLQST